MPLSKTRISIFSCSISEAVYRTSDIKAYHVLPFEEEVLAPVDLAGGGHVFLALGVLLLAEAGDLDDGVERGPVTK